MGSFFKFFATSAMLSLTLGSTAQAADLPRGYPPPSMVEMPPLLVDEFGSGWYLRGDVGYRFNKVGTVTNDGARAVTGDDIDNSWMVGVGGGYKWQWFRADLTADYGAAAKYKGDTASMAGDFTAKIDSFTGLVNVYGDLGTWYGLTPYIGAGIGFTHLGAADFTQHFQAAVATPDTTAKWNFAWAYMAGVSYNIFGKYHLDLGYRHINMGDISTGTDAYGNRLTLNDVAADEVRLGFRYLID
ncbi:MAG: outer membrane beta-barrel protein [Xanthobacteraceae bacterium]